MADRNLFIAIALSLLVLSVWSYLQPPAPPPSPAAATQPAASAPAPAVPTPTPAQTPRGVTPVQPEALAPEPAEQLVEITNDLYHATLSSRGGELREWQLQQYVEADRPGRPKVVLTTSEAGDPAALSTPLLELGVGDWSKATFDVTRPDANTIVFSRTRAGISVRKTYVLDPENYLLTLRLQVTNGSAAAVEPVFGVLWPARVSTQWDFHEYALVAFQDGSLHKSPLAGAGQAGFFGSLVSSGPPEDPFYDANVEWAGAETRYFLSVMVPDLARDASARFVTLAPGQAAEAALTFSPVSIPPGQSIEREIRVYVGPKDEARLEAVGANLSRSIDLGYSWMAPLTQLFVWLLRAFYAVIPNYGIAIILLTVLVRVVTMPLTAKQMASMKRLGALQPQMKAIQERFPDDRQKQQEAIMKLYKDAGVSPLTAVTGGCFPILLQFPVFVGLYYALQSSIELRQAPFFGWIQDLSAPEALFTIPGIDLPVRVLPLVMGLSMVVQAKIAPQPTADPAQARMMATIMPVLFTVMFYTFPSGLVLYWLVSNVLAAGQQWWMMRGQPTPEPAPVAAPRPRGKG